MYIYGEGWNFGAVAGRQALHRPPARPTSAARASAASATASATRCAAAGRSTAAPNHVQNQGFISGWFYDPNALNTGSAAEREALIKDTDNIRALAGRRPRELPAHERRGRDGDRCRRSTTGGQKSGYTKDPQEAINYASKHDNETLWDISQYKHATGTPLGGSRAGATTSGMSVIMLGAGHPVHARRHRDPAFEVDGPQLLRLRRLVQRDRLDAGDTASGTRACRAPADNSRQLRPDQASHPGRDGRSRTSRRGRRALANFKELLQIRKSSPLFRLRNQAQIDQRVKFYNTGPFQFPGLVAMGIDGCTEPGLAPAEGALMVVFNASDDAADAEPVRRRDLDAAPGAGRLGRPRSCGPRSTMPTASSCRRAPRRCSAGRRRPPARRSRATCSCAAASTTGATRRRREQYKLQFLGGTVYSVSAPIGAAGNRRVQDRRCGLDGRHELRRRRGGRQRPPRCAADARVPVDGSGNLTMFAPIGGQLHVRAWMPRAPRTRC